MMGMKGQMKGGLVDLRQRCEFCNRVRSHGNHSLCSKKRKAKYQHLHD